MELLQKLMMISTAFTLVCGIFTGCSDKNLEEHEVLDDSTAQQNSDIQFSENDDPEQITVLEKSPESTDPQELGSFTITLYPEYAPETCENFQNLIEQGFYDGLTFHRVVDDFMAQGGDPTGTGTGGSENTIKGEFAQNGYEANTLSHTRGIVSMARSSDPDSASSQFFICYQDCNFLDGQYAAFGEVTEGMEIVDKFLEVDRAYNSGGELAVPIQPITISKAEMIDSDSEGQPRAQFTITVG